MNKRERVAVRRLADLAQNLLDLFTSDEVTRFYETAAKHGFESPNMNHQKAQSIIDKAREVVP
ncbi:MAG: hypothetical protein OXH70_17315 [Acidobacteria bacterium]|nr:hypothetical protein [Acidobacteriota bacterium]